MEAFYDLVFEHGELSQQSSGLEGVEAAVHAESNVVVATILTVEAGLRHFPRKLVVAGEAGPAVAIVAEWFRGEETGDGDVDRLLDLRPL
jgi:hypothetical protein